MRCRSNTWIYRRSVIVLDLWPIKLARTVELMLRLTIREANARRIGWTSAACGSPRGIRQMCS
jgi:hypothetical protein